MLSAGAAGEVGRDRSLLCRVESTYPTLFTGVALPYLGCRGWPQKAFTGEQS